MEIDPCPGCGAKFAAGEGPTHADMESSVGCWTAFGEVLARESGEASCFVAHQLTVDAYAVQHPGRPSARSIQSVALHLISLHAVLERGVEPAQATGIIRRAAGHKSRFAHLMPPEDRGATTVAEVHQSGSAPEHVRRVREWTASAWAAWSPHHATVREWAQAAIDGPRRREG